MNNNLKNYKNIWERCMIKKMKKGQYLKYFAFQNDLAMKCSYDLRELVCFSI